jgi:hypothetical protein
MTRGELYELVCETFYGPSPHVRTEDEVITRLTDQGVLAPDATDFVAACANPEHPEWGLSDATFLALDQWIYG